MNCYACLLNVNAFGDCRGQGRLSVIDVADRADVNMRLRPDELLVRKPLALLDMEGANIKYPAARSGSFAGINKRPSQRRQ